MIGAGGAGLAALHAMQQEGFETQAFEKNGELGGVWATTRYPSLTIHSQSFNYRFHDHPPVTSAGPCATRDELLAYFAGYARDKRIADRIQYHRRVDRIVHRPDRASERCLVIATDVRTGETSEHACDVVVCASGLSNAGAPHVPVLEAKAMSRVQVLHSSELTPELYREIVERRRRIVVLGAGKSAHEILSLFRDTDRAKGLTWVYAKSLWSLSYEALYGKHLVPWNVALYVYYVKLSALRRRIGYGRSMKVLQAPLRWSGMLVNPLEPDTDVCTNRSAIMKRDQLDYLKTLRSIKARVTGLGETSVMLDSGESIGADVLICATGYDRRQSLPSVTIERPDGTEATHSLADRHAFYNEMIDLDVPEVSLLSASVLYAQQLLGYSLGAQWLARFHRGTLTRPPSAAQMRRSLEDAARRFAPWCSGDYMSGGLPYAHQRNDDALAVMFDQMGLAPRLARELVRRGANEAAFSDLCDQIARQLVPDDDVQRGRGMKPSTTNRST